MGRCCPYNRISCGDMMDKMTIGGIFFAGMATTYILQKTKVFGAENRVFNSLWVGDDHKTTIEGGKMKFKKNASPPPNTSKQQIQHKTKGTIMEYHADRPKYHKYIRGNDYKTDFNTRERLASQYTELTSIQTDLTNMSNELDSVVDKAEELKDKLRNLTATLDSKTDTYDREMSAYSATKKDSRRNRRISADKANGAKAWRNAKTKEARKRRSSQRAETKGNFLNRFFGR